MKTKLSIIAVLLLAFCAANYAQVVVVTGHKVTYTRPKPISDGKRTFTVNYPRIRATTVALSRKIEAAFSYEKAFAISINEEINEIQWLYKADFKVLYNNNGLLNIALTIDGSGAYPDGSTRSVIVDTKTGNRILPGDVFVYIGGLVDMVWKVHQKEIAVAIAEIKANKDLEEPEPERLFENARFRMDNLKGFAVDAKGVTFFYDYGFPHAIQAMEPPGEFKFTWTQMKPYIRVNGALGRMTR